jgi:hypothetical protein
LRPSARQAMCAEATKNRSIIVSFSAEPRPSTSLGAP